MLEVIKEEGTLPDAYLGWDRSKTVRHLLEQMSTYRSKEEAVEVGISKCFLFEELFKNRDALTRRQRNRRVGNCVTLAIYLNGRKYCGL